MDLKNRWIIAEIGSTHDGSFGNAQKLIEAAAKSGANCVKFQTHIADAETLCDAPSPSYFSAESRKAYFERTGFSLSQWKKLYETAGNEGVVFLSSPFSIEAVDLLEEIGVAAFKIPSGEMTNLPLLRRVARTGKSVLLSSGMSNWTEIEMALDVFKDQSEICLMQCTSMYPCSPTFVGLNNIAEISRRFPKVTIGYSDHTLGVAASVAAVILGANVIEKHFTFSRLMYGSDAKNSMEPSQFLSFASELKDAWVMRDNPVDKDKLASEVMGDMKIIFQKSVVAATAISAGTVLDEGHLAYKKPGDGISASYSNEIVGRRLKMTVSKDHKFSWDDFS